MSKYDQWIDAYVAGCSGFVRGRCGEATAAMILEFPELRRIAGFVFCTWGRDQHYWCLAPDGTIVDPTVSQFVSVFEYGEMDVTDAQAVARIPTGKCLNCAEDTYAREDTCSPECCTAFAHHLMAPREQI